MLSGCNSYNVGNKEGAMMTGTRFDPFDAVSLRYHHTVTNVFLDASNVVYQNKALGGRFIVIFSLAIHKIASLLKSLHQASLLYLI